MFFFFLPYLVILVGATIHVFADRKENKKTARRVVELYLIWIVGVSGFFSIYGGIGHIGPTRAEIADMIGPGYIPSMFQWENAWADIGVGVALIVSVWKRNGFMTATVLIWTILYWGDAVGHVMQLVAHDNTAIANVWTIPSDFAVPLAAVVLLIVYRRLSRTTDGESGEADKDAPKVAVEDSGESEG